jgi:hypothetical protein
MNVYRSATMADQKQLSLIKEDVGKWNLWRQAHSTVPDLSEAELSDANLQGANLQGANLHGATFCGANLIAASLDFARLSSADLSGARLLGAQLRVVEQTQNERHWQLALDAFTTSAAAWALSFKESRWASESEVRMILRVRPGQTVSDEHSNRADGSDRRFITVPVTTLSLMPVEDLVIGPNQNQAEGVTRAVRLLRELGYRRPDERVALSSVQLSAQAE